MAKRADFEIKKNLKQMPRVVFDDEPKSGLCSEIGQRKKKCLRKPNLQSLANPANFVEWPTNKEQREN